MVNVYVEAIGHKRNARKKNKLKKALLAEFLPMYATVKKRETVEEVEEPEEPEQAQ